MYSNPLTSRIVRKPILVDPRNSAEAEAIVFRLNGFEHTFHSTLACTQYWIDPKKVSI